MTDDFLADYERELHAAAQRRRRRFGRTRRALPPALAAAAAAAAVAAVVLVAGGLGPGEAEVEVPPGATGTGAAVCAPPPALRDFVAALTYDPPPAGPPPAVRRLFGERGSAAARYARIWGRADGVTYWVVPQLRCDRPTAADTSSEPEDGVCIYPLFDGEESVDGGGARICATPEHAPRRGTWIHFPLRTGGAAVVGFAPRGATEARVRVAKGGFEQRFAVRDGVWGGTLEGYVLRGEVGGLEVEFDVATDSPTVAALNGTTAAGAATEVIEALVDVNYRRGDRAVGNWSEPDVERSVVYYAAGKRWLGERVAIYLGERFRSDRPAVQEMTPEVRALGGEGADAVVVVGRDLVQ